MMNSLHPTASAGGEGVGGSDELNFANYEFSLAPPPDRPSPQHSMPHAPMQDFDLGSLTTSEVNNENNSSNAHPQGAENSSAADVGGGAGNMDLDLNLVGVNGNFDDLFYENKDESSEGLLKLDNNFFEF
jgi:hypothetical protein